MPIYVIDGRLLESETPLKFAPDVEVRQATPEEVKAHAATHANFENPPPPTWEQMRLAAYPAPHEFMDAYVEERNGNPAKMQAYLEACAAVKKQYPKPEEKAPEKKPKK